MATIMYEKQNDHVAEPFMTSGGTRTYIVSEPEAASKYFQIPGAHLTSAPHVKPASTDGERGNTQAHAVAKRGGEGGILPGEGRNGPSAMVTAAMAGAWRTRRS